MSISQKDLSLISACSWIRMIKNQHISAEELTNLFLQRLEKLNPHFGPFLHVAKKQALIEAKKIDRYSAQEKLSFPLLGLPSVIPEVFNMQHEPTSFGSALLKDNTASADDLEVQHLKNAGAIILGKTNMSEFDLFPDTCNRLSSPCLNPHNPKYSPGGSSGGSACAVALGLSPVALATDYCGSLRISSSFCGVCGLMTTRDPSLTSKKHLLPYSEKMFYRKGAISRYIEDLDLLIDNVFGSKTNPAPHQKHLDKSSANPKLKIGVCDDFDIAPSDSQVETAMRKALEILKGLGHDIGHIPLHIDEDLLTHFQHIFSVDRYLMIMQLLESDPSRFTLLEPYTKDWLNTGDKVTGVQYSMAQAYTEWLQHSIESLFDTYDLLLLPTAPTAPFPSQKPTNIITTPWIHPLLSSSLYTCSFNMSGHPALVLPCIKNKEGLPIGIQLVGNYWKEKTLLNIGKQYQEAVGKEWETLTCSSSDLLIEKS